MSSRNFTFHTGGIPGNIPDPDAIGCCMNTPELFCDENDNCDGVIYTSILSTLENCVRERQVFLQNLKIKNINNRNVITLKLNKKDLQQLDAFVNNEDENMDFSICKWVDANCTDIKGLCCTDRDLNNPCNVLTKEECEDYYINDPVNKYYSSLFTKEGITDEDMCIKYCSSYVIVCGGPLLIEIMGGDELIKLPPKKGIVVPVREFDLIYKDKDGTFKIKPNNKFYTLSSDTNLYFNEDQANSILNNSLKYLCISPESFLGESFGLTSSQCIQLSSLCYDIDGLTTYESLTECLTSSECDIRVSLVVFDNYGCKYIKCIENIHPSEVIDIIEEQVFLINNNDSLETTKLRFKIIQKSKCIEEDKIPNKYCNNNLIINDNTNIIEDRFNNPDDCSRCVNGDCVPDIVQQLDECLQCGGEGLYGAGTSAYPKCDVAENYNYETGECDYVECGPCERLVEAYRRPNKVAKGITVESPCVFYTCVSICDSNEYCCNDECIPTNEECVEPSPSPSPLPSGCSYTAEIKWSGPGDESECPQGFVNIGLTEEGKTVCGICETTTDIECDEYAWWANKDPGENWILVLNSLGSSQSGCN